ncbi:MULTISPECIES: hypothetical protein [unclassified Microcoleus]|uniref:hypothetical protein n=1 Tax=unclassified Microcoleus TaxID=2642155 RepID=UPI002FD1151A
MGYFLDRLNRAIVVEGRSKKEEARSKSQSTAWVSATKNVLTYLYLSKLTLNFQKSVKSSNKIAGRVA